jgi:hypothetical protein
VAGGRLPALQQHTVQRGHQAMDAENSSLLVVGVRAKIGRSPGHDAMQPERRPLRPSRLPSHCQAEWETTSKSGPRDAEDRKSSAPPAPALVLS